MWLSCHFCWIFLGCLSTFHGARSLGGGRKKVGVLNFLGLGRVTPIGRREREGFGGSLAGGIGGGGLGSDVGTFAVPEGPNGKYPNESNDVPLNLYKPTAPYTSSVVSVRKLVGPKSPGETYHVVLDHGGNVPYVEGQSYAVVPPGIDPRTLKNNRARMYSIASTRYGDDGTGTTASLCVRRAVYVDPETKEAVPEKAGIASNFLCNATPGQKVQISGPCGKVMLMPESSDVDIIMVATGSGIAPYRGFLRRLFSEKTKASESFGALAWMIFGVPNKDALLYDDEWKTMTEQQPNKFRIDYALSREQTNKNGGRMYVQDRITESADEVFERMDRGAHMYLCGLKGMMPGIIEAMESEAKKRKRSWEETLAAWKANKQWRVEVY